ncbi:membrane protein DedA with SNARE-associated domain [Streptomyces sp. 2333.5]|uniref:DedA family protein n=1 Tax=Streptomyces TaxID=1883 RepID=UPI000895199E|nr:MULTISPECIES: VTT domain-containing protein [unclassified Streptomyces]PJJ01700.1 membrane protein DedA with SNARE-associated domain [Streptomyces sp. 2333.5]SED55284.1 membrane protein DedA, SNARE-associated domain [Streptomyces sp. 2112.2]
MLESLGSLSGTPWVYVVVSCSIVLDVFVPILPSGILVIAAATTSAGAGSAVDAVGRADVAASVHGGASLAPVFSLLLCAATASVLGDMVAYRLAWRGGDRFDRAIGRSRRLTAAQRRLGTALTRGGGIVVVLARFAPAGRSVVSLGAGVAHRTVREFLPWSALAGLAWAAYSVSLGYFGGQWLGTSWVSTAISAVALFGAGSAAAFLMRRPERGTAG